MSEPPRLWESALKLRHVLFPEEREATTQLG
jgi:hypothetical protein